jgi:hypothetical protein
MAKALTVKLVENINPKAKRKMIRRRSLALETERAAS